jgi:hypothetical protein
MPQDWLPIDSNLADKSEIQAIVDATDLEVATVLGRIVIFWSKVDQHGVLLEETRDQFFDGLVPGYTLKALTRLCGGDPKFWRLVESQAWLKSYSDGIGIPGFSRRFSASSKMRISDARRKQIKRDRDKASDNRLDRPDKCPEPTGHSEDYRTVEDRTVEDSERTKQKSGPDRI